MAKLTKKEEKTWSKVLNIISFPGYFMILVAWLAVIVTVGVWLADKTGDVVTSTSQEPATTFDFSNVNAAGGLVMLVISVIIWYFLSKIPKGVIKKIASLGGDPEKLQTVLKFGFLFVGWALVLIFASALQVYVREFVAVSVGAFSNGLISFLAEDLVKRLVLHR